MTIQFDQKGKYFTAVITKKALQAVIQTRTHSIKGQIHVRQGQRVKDALEESGLYLAVTEATIYDAQGQALYQTEFLAIHQDQIVWVLPCEDILPLPKDTS